LPLACPLTRPMQCCPRRRRGGTQRRRHNGHCHADGLCSAFSKQRQEGATGAIVRGQTRRGADRACRSLDPRLRPTAARCVCAHARHPRVAPPPGLDGLKIIPRLPSAAGLVPAATTYDLANAVPATRSRTPLRPLALPPAPTPPLRSPAPNPHPGVCCSTVDGCGNTRREGEHRRKGRTSRKTPAAQGSIIAAPASVPAPPTTLQQTHAFNGRPSPAAPTHPRLKRHAAQCHGCPNDKPARIPDPPRAVPLDTATAAAIPRPPPPARPRVPTQRPTPTATAARRRAPAAPSRRRAAPPPPRRRPSAGASNTLPAGTRRRARPAAGLAP